MLIIFEALLLPALIDAARRWPPTKNCNGQRRGGAAFSPLLMNNPAADDYSIIVCRIIEATSAHHTMTNKGGLSPDYKRTELIWPSATQEYQTALPNFQSN